MKKDTATFLARVVRLEAKNVMSMGRSCLFLSTATMDWAK